MLDSLSSRNCWDTFTNFLFSQKAVLMLAEMKLCLVILIAFRGSKIEFFSLSGIEFDFAAVNFVILSSGLHTKSTCISWSWCEFFRPCGAAILYLIFSIPDLTEKGNRTKIMEGLLGLFATCLFGYDAFISFPLRQ
ncbi:proteolipid protein 2-like [Molossus nigricans]